MSPPPARSRALILVCLADPAARLAVAADFIPARLPPATPFSRVAVEELDLNAVDARIRRAFRWPGTTGVVLVSDGLVHEDGDGFAMTSAAKDLFAEFGERLYATVALAPQPWRVPDVDRVAGPGAGPDVLAGCVRRCLDRLGYFLPPQPPPGGPGPVVEVRPVEYEHDLEGYFRLRHQVYSTMCYLDPLIEDYPRGLELDWFDTQAVHYGAFARIPGTGGERLVGTARLILTARADGPQADLVTRVIDSDPVFRMVVDNGCVGVRLPVFQSQLALAPPSAVLAALFDRVAADEAVVAEVSRVIVHQDFRGLGLSRRLTRQLVDAAVARGVSDMLLECLPRHAGVYEAVGFRPLGTRANVFGINRTMTAMHRPLTPAPAAVPV